MLEQVENLIEEYAMLPPGGTVLCAVSGGADSVCLLHLLRERAGRGEFSLAAAHYDHRLRGEDSTADAQFVENLCKMWTIPLCLGSGDVAGEARRRGKGVEETARAMRYAFLEEAAAQAGADVIATAHNADDNAETLLLHLVRGTGLQGLAGIPPRRGKVVRPLLTVTRAEIRAYLEKNGLTWREDGSNADERYARNYLRAQVMPRLRELNPRLEESLSRTARLLRADRDFLNAQAFQVAQNARWAEDDLVIEARYIAQAPAAIAPRAVRQILSQMGGEGASCTSAHLEAVVDLARGADPSAMVDLPGGLMVQRVYRELLFTTREEAETFPPTALVPEGEVWPEGALYGCRCRRSVCPQAPGGDTYYIAAFHGTPVLRPRQTGDHLQRPGRPRRRIKKLLIDEKIPRRDRERLPVLADEGGVIALAGFGPEAARLARAGEAAWEITFLPGAENPARESRERMHGLCWNKTLSGSSSPKRS